MSGYMESRWNLVALAVVSTSNRPLLSQLFLSEAATRHDELNLQFLLHSSLDVCDERVDARVRRDLAQSANARNTVAAGASIGGAAGASVSGSGAGPSSANNSRPTTMSYVESSKQSPCFLDKLLQSQRFWTWGYQSASGIRVLAVTHGDAPREALHQILKQTYESVSVALSNPFFDPDATLDSDAFLRKISTIAAPHTVMRRLVE